MHIRLLLDAHLFVRCTILIHIFKCTCALRCTSLDAHLFVFTFKFHLNEHTEIRTLIQIVFSYNDYLYIILY